MTKKLIVAVLALLVVGSGVYFVFGNKSEDTPTDSTQSNSTEPKQEDTTKASSATITYSDDGFSPATTTVNSGDTVTIKNTSSTSLQLESDPHPAHTSDTDLNVGSVSTGQSRTFTVTKKGSFGFHNHQKPSDTGEITVQ